MVYVYLIESVHQRQQHYVGFTENLKKRLADHNDGKSPHTRKFRPWHLIAYFGFADEQTARDFEKYLKSGSGKAFLNKHFIRNTKAPPMTSFPPKTFDRGGFLAMVQA